MPLITGCGFNNPIAAAFPSRPLAAAADRLAPAQGDHLFGDVLGSVETALQSIFGGGAVWPTRMQHYSPTLHSVWTGLDAVDLGHAANPPIVQRTGAAEPDEHAYVFGGYSRRLQWQLCEIVCTGFAASEMRSIGGATRSWKTAVLNSFDDVMNHLVDSTALHFYIATPHGIRQANASTVNHTPISLAEAVVYASRHAGPGQRDVLRVLSNYSGLRTSFVGLLDRFDGPTKTLAPHHLWA